MLVSLTPCPVSACVGLFQGKRFQCTRVVACDTSPELEQIGQRKSSALIFHDDLVASIGRRGVCKLGNGIDLSRSDVSLEPVIRQVLDELQTQRRTVELSLPSAWIEPFATTGDASDNFYWREGGRSAIVQRRRTGSRPSRIVTRRAMVRQGYRTTSNGAPFFKTRLPLLHRVNFVQLLLSA